MSIVFEGFKIGLTVGAAIAGLFLVVGIGIALLIGIMALIGSKL